MSAASPSPLDPATAVGPVALTVRDLPGLTSWYQRVLGLRTLAENGRAVVLGAADGTPIVTLAGNADAPLASRRAPGLYHVAVLMPSRADLGRWIRHTAEIGVRLQGASDHLVSEATYLADPEGNGIEVYRDRAKHEWPVRDGKIHMDNAPFDIRGVVGAGDAAGGRFDGAPAGTTVGHVHLKVADIPATRRFYVETLGFESTEEGYPSALFVSAGGYHHHFGLNTWESAGGTRTAGATGLRAATVTMPAAARAALLERLAARGVAVDGPSDLPSVVDPSGNRLAFAATPVDAETALALA
jgi:catechol 2,3-dioxygenase